MFGQDFFKDKVPIIGRVIKMMGDADMDYGPFAAGLALFLLLLSLFVFGVSLGQILSVFFAITPIWLPIILFLLFFSKWTDMVGTSFYLNQGRTTLRLRLPQDVFKSPEAMEFVIEQIHNTANPDNLFQTYLDGKRPLPFSFEIVSVGGEVRFYVNVPTKKTRDAIEANLYAQYPGIEVVEDPVDYAAELPLEYEKDDWQLMAFHMGKKKSNAFPIKTYIDFGLDKLPKEEEKLDPITPMLEVIAGIKPYERIFIQFICIPFRIESFKNGQLVTKEGPDWSEEVTKEVDKIMNRDPETKLPLGATESDDDNIRSAILTAGERDKIAAMERNAGKYAYKTAIRWLYVTKKDKFNGDIINPVLRSFSQYDIIGRNAVGAKWRTDFNYKDWIPGQKQKALAALKTAELTEYRLRLYEPKGDGDGYKIFTTEELATMFHLPGKVAMTPTLDRVPSTRGEAPPNLPIGELPQ